MNCNPTITAEEFKNIHNALCDLRDIRNLIKNVVREDISAQLSLAITKLEQGLTGAYEQDNAAENTKMRHYTEVQDDQGLVSVWSIYEVDNLYAEHPYPYCNKIQYGDVYKSIFGNRWVDLYIAADRAIKASGDDQRHIFIEKLQARSEPGVLELSCGS
jgi:hypothetical protein